MVANYVGLLQDANKVSNNITMLSWMALLWLVASIIILLKAIFTREMFDKKLKLGAILIVVAVTVGISLSFF